jgi:hypothetical protein
MFHRLHAVASRVMLGIFQMALGFLQVALPPSPKWRHTPDWRGSAEGARGLSPK